MKTYERYKPSGVEWIGDIPEHWRMSRLKFVLSQNDGGVWGDDWDGMDENATKVFRSTEINLDGSWNVDEAPELRLLSKQEKNKAQLIEGDLLVTKSSGSQLHIGKTALVTSEIEKQECCYSNFTQRLRPLHKESSRYLHIFLNSNLAREQYNFLSNSTTGLANLSAGLISEILVPTPDLQEQTAIAKYLDEKTAQIDKLIAGKRRLIALLKEERSGVINNAVTRGINPHAKLKPSGVDWLGEIPTHWEVKKLKWVCQITDCKHTTPIYIEIGIPVVSTGNVKPKQISFESARKVSQRDFEELSEGGRKPVKNDIIYSRNASVGAAALVRSEEEFCLGQDICLIRSNQNQEFLENVLNGSYVSAQLESVLVGSTFRRINIQQIKEFEVALPSAQEQVSIVEFIEAETGKIDATVAKIEKEIEYLREYRTALISEVVTGKIKVV